MIFESQRPSSAPEPSRSPFVELFWTCNHAGQLKFTTAVSAFGADMKLLT
jgi:hypothetical protein